jgi:hypothetical protein
MFELEGRFSIDNGGIATSYVRRYDLTVYTFEKCSYGSVDSNRQAAIASAQGL